MKKSFVKFAAFIFFLSIAYDSIAQMNYWTVIPNKINVQSSAGVVSTLPGAPSGTYAASNGAYDGNGNLLFYVVDQNIIKPNGTSAGWLYSTGGGAGAEIIIVPKPGSCSNFYVFYTVYLGFIGVDLLFTEISCSGSNVSVVSSGVIDSFSSNVIGIAASKPLSNGNRWLFAIGWAALKKYSITNNGIICPSDATILDDSFISSNDIETEATELELYEGTSPMNWTLAWGTRMTNKVFKINVTPNTATLVAGSFLAKTVPTNASIINGLEFSSSVYVYVSGGNGVYQVPLSSSAPTLLANSANYGRSHIEKAKNGKYYVISNSGKFGEISGNQIIASASPLSNITVVSEGFGMGYTLNDQVDGDNYNYFFGVGQTAINNYKVNNTTLSATIPPTALEVYNCNPILLTATYAGSPTQYNIDIFTTSSSNGQQVICGTCLNYSSGWITATPPASIDIRNLPGTNGTWLQTHTGNYGVRLTVKNQCNQVVKLGQIKVNGAPPAAQINLQINNGNTGIPCSASHNITTPCLTGIYSGSFNLSNSNGTISFYQINSIQEVNCATGVATQTIYSGQQEPTSGVSGLTAKSFNSLVINGNTGYFAANGLNKCYKVTITVGNACGSSTDWTYFKCDGAYKTADVASFSSPDVELYPNPFVDWLTLDYSLSEESIVSLSLLDISGRVVSIPMPAMSQTMGKHQTNLYLGNLAKGIYFYQFTDGSTRHTGKIVKTTD